MDIELDRPLDEDHADDPSGYVDSAMRSMNTSLYQMHDDDKVIAMLEEDGLDPDWLRGEAEDWDDIDKLRLAVRIMELCGTREKHNF